MKNKIYMLLVQDLPQDGLKENELCCGLCCAVDWSLAD